jgi:hypothetical protein
LEVFLFPRPAFGVTLSNMNNKQPRPLTWLFPACLAVGIIAALSLLAHSLSGKRPAQGTSSSPSMGGTAPAAATTSTLDLVGVVKGADGRPVTNASIFIYTAQPRSGPGFL